MFIISFNFAKDKLEVMMIEPVSYFLLIIYTWIFTLFKFEFEICIFIDILFFILISILIYISINIFFFVLINI